MSKKWDKELNLIAQIEGWLSDEVAELLMSFAARVSKGVIVEVGSWKGKSTVGMALANPNCKIYAVDPFTGSQEHEHLAASKVDTYSEFVENIQKYQVKEQITPLRMTSREALHEVKEDIITYWKNHHKQVKKVKRRHFTTRKKKEPKKPLQAKKIVETKKMIESLT